MAETKTEQSMDVELTLPHPDVNHSADPLLRAHLLPCRLILEAPIVDFTVGTLMWMQPGSVLETAAQHNEDLLLHVNGQIVGPVKFDVTGDRLAVRLTGIA